MSKLVIALGGNALGKDYLQQQKSLHNVLSILVPLIKGNHQIVITHGNGPQVGMINLAFEKSNIDMPLDVCTAMSQGYIGYHIQKELSMLMKENNIDRKVVTVVTEVVVDKNDVSFKCPTKPIGSFYCKEDALKLFDKNNIPYMEDSGRGYRKVVASPKPIDILQYDTIKALIDNNQIVIACGGGGIPVYNDLNHTRVDAVIDKDLASAKLAIELKADYLIILTAVNQVEINYNMPNSKKLGVVTVTDARNYLSEGQFAPGSMKPKIEAAIDFLNNSDGKVIITGLNNLNNIFNREDITIIKK